MTDSVSSPGQEYGRSGLSRASAHSDPIEQFRSWFEECRGAGVPEPNAMTLSTVGSDGRPSARMVLLKGFDHEGFAFFTNYRSRKSRELAVNPNASLVFWWQGLERQVRIEGVSERLDGVAADEYFRTRPRESQLGAWASPQSSPLSSRAELEVRLRAVEEQYPAEVPRPDHWGGFRVRPDRIEFWQGRPGRLHDRLQYTKAGNNWIVERLAP